MKTKKFQPRFYREWVQSKDLINNHIIVKETDIYISSDVALDENFLKDKIQGYRKQIEDYILVDKDFLTSLKPIDTIKPAPQIVKDMAQATKIAGVGPMAAVAGAIAEYLARDLEDKTKELIIENGGDIFLKTETKRRIGIFAGESKLSGKIILEIEAEETPVGICTSSGTVGHSLSFGITDATIILAKSLILADAVATATGNIVKKPEDINKAIEFAKSIKDVTAAMVIVGDLMSAWGNLKIEKAK
ncbi:MAG: UPF0280 family protein [Candidatus Omnitrophica bacterium]|nr:UPF0280 family protein [Candidatus Omnitrophota bacterium]